MVSNININVVNTPSSVEFAQPPDPPTRLGAIFPLFVTKQSFQSDFPFQVLSALFPSDYAAQSSCRGGVLTRDIMPSKLPGS